MNATKSVLQEVRREIASLQPKTKRRTARRTPEQKRAKRDYNRVWRKRKEQEETKEAVAIINVLLPDWRLPGRAHKLNDKIGALLPQGFKATIRRIAKEHNTSMSEVVRRRLGGLL